jgi:hypothetical protein
LVSLTVVTYPARWHTDQTDASVKADFPEDAQQSYRQQEEHVLRMLHYSRESLARECHQGRGGGEHARPAVPSLGVDGTIASGSKRSYDTVEDTTLSSGHGAFTDLFGDSTQSVAHNESGTDSRKRDFSGAFAVTAPALAVPPRQCPSSSGLPNRAATQAAVPSGSVWRGTSEPFLTQADVRGKFTNMNRSAASITPSAPLHFPPPGPAAAQRAVLGSQVRTQELPALDSTEMFLATEPRSGCVVFSDVEPAGGRADRCTATKCAPAGVVFAAASHAPTQQPSSQPPFRSQRPATSVSRPTLWSQKSNVDLDALLDDL